MMRMRDLARLEFRPAARPAAGLRVPPRAARSRRRSARSAVAWGAVALALATAGLGAATDTVKPEWRDPEFGHRLRQARRWREKAPGRPLVLAVGSSRTQMGLDPAAMGFPDEPGSPLVYNLGYRGAHSLGTWLQLMRVLDAGVRPDAVLVQLAPYELAVAGSAESYSRPWVSRDGAGDLRRLAPYTGDPWPFRRAWAGHRLTAWVSYRGPIVNDLAPDWQSPSERVGFTWEAMDEYGFTPVPDLPVLRERRAETLAAVRELQGRTLDDFRVAATTEAAFRDLTDRCRREGIPVAFFRIPESPTYRSWYSPASRVAAAEYQRRLTEEPGVAVFPAPEFLAEEDFVDGYHLMGYAAARYSRWLADTHIRPWLAGKGVAR